MAKTVEFLITMFHSEVTLYSGFFALFIAAIIYLFFRENKVEKMAREFQRFSMVLLMLMCFPPFFQISTMFFIESNQYFQLLWLIPVLPVLGYVFVECFYEQKKRKEKGIWLILCAVLLYYSGNCVYFQPEWQENGYSAWNPYLEEQIEVCEFLHAYDSKALLAVRQEEILPLLRQVSGDIHLIYGADIWLGGGNYSEDVEELFYMMQSDEIYMLKLISKAKKLGVTYLLMDPWWLSQEVSNEPIQWDDHLKIIYQTEHYQLLAI